MQKTTIKGIPDRPEQLEEATPAMASLPSSVQRRRTVRRHRSHHQRPIGRFLGIVGGLYCALGIAGNGLLLALLLRVSPEYLPPVGRMLLFLLPILMLWFILSGIALFRGIEVSVRIVAYSTFGMAVLCILFLRTLSLVQLPAAGLAFLNMVVFCLVVDSRFKMDFQRIAHHRRRRKR